MHSSDEFGNLPPRRHSGGELIVTGEDATPRLTGTLYENGTEVGRVTNLPHYPARLGKTQNNWIGRSQNEGDQFLDGLVDEFRIYQYGLSPDQIRALADGADASGGG